MTEHEAILVLKDFDKQVAAKADGAYQSTIGKMACDMAISALEEIQQYRALGTVEELAEIQNSYFILDQKVRRYEKIGIANELQQLKEKYTKKKPMLSSLSIRKRKLYICPNCFNECLAKEANERQDNMFCWNCGQAIDWSEV